MPLQVIGHSIDQRTHTPVVYGQIPITEYLDIVGNDFENFTIQRRREKHKAYTRLKQDIRNGAVLPPITLSVKPHLVGNLRSLIPNQLDDLAKELSKPGQLDILDGLQRTYLIHDLIEDGVQLNPDQKLLLEFWLEPSLPQLIYRIIVLNAGQKPMSMRHQVELLFMSLRQNIQQMIDGLEIHTERDQTRRRRAKKYALNVVASAYHAFITKSPEVSRENVVAMKMAEADALDATESELEDGFNKFASYLRVYSDLDEEICRVYGVAVREFSLDGENEPAQVSVVNWFGSENLLMSFFAAIAQFSTTQAREERVLAALQSLLDQLREIPEDAGSEHDILGIANVEELRSGINPRKKNVGAALRKMLTNGFKEFFREEGEVPLAECWVQGED